MQIRHKVHLLELDWTKVKHYLRTAYIPVWILVRASVSAVKLSFQASAAEHRCGFVGSIHWAVIPTKPFLFNQWWSR